MRGEQLNILLIDDEASMRHMLRLTLEREHYRVTEVANGAAALTLLATETFDLVLCDIRMPGLDGLSLLRELRERSLTPTVIMMSAYGSIETALECMKNGAYDYISKPFKPDEVLLTLKKAEERLRLQDENRKLATALSHCQGSATRPLLVFRSPVMQQVTAMVEKLAASHVPVLISGETGTGKELIARALHSGSPRAAGPFIAVNCSAIPAGLMESELFGHARGSFTGADRHHDGLFTAASGGTLFLDEIGELPLALQPKLLRVLQEGEVLRIGETKPRRVDVRIVAATVKNLHDEVARGTFREDLYYRLAVTEVRLPALRERREDIGPLAEHFLHHIATRENRPPPRLTAEAITRLRKYDWPGNIRELENFVEKMIVFSPGDCIDAADLPWDAQLRGAGSVSEYSLKVAVARLEEEYIGKALHATGGNRTHAAELLEISLRNLQYKIKEYGI
ncbi:MAG: sigma-54 dependent transcriptional regulator [Desulfuromonadales bacterium]|nr:sigma-54 dependent transcriptional regulator [Desulfuromonadales bacterium]